NLEHRYTLARGGRFKRHVHRRFTHDGAERAVSIVALLVVEEQDSAIELAPDIVATRHEAREVAGVHHVPFHGTEERINHHQGPRAGIVGNERLDLFGGVDWHRHR